MSVDFQIKTPYFSNITLDDLDHIYEPSEDTFLLIDALEEDLDLIKERRPSICMEVGSGSGVVLTALATALKPTCFYIATDINPRACTVTQETARINGVRIDAVNADLTQGFRRSGVDVLIFNPPYVATPSEEVGRGDLELTWAGGEKGREVTDRLLPLVSGLLSPDGMFYLVLSKENKPQEVLEIMKKEGFSGENVFSRSTRLERLSVWRFERK